VELMDGFGIVPVVMGMFGLGEILLNAENPVREIFTTKLSRLTPPIKDLRDSVWPVVRGTGIGFFMGIIPGIGGTVPTFLSYAMEKRLSKYPERFGTGVIEGVAGPETANNAAVIAHLIPFFALGLPINATMAILMGAFMMNGLTPGPALFTEHGEFAWAVIASLYIGNVMLLILNVPLIPMWVAILRVPYAILFALILAFVTVGAYTVSGSVFEVGAVLGFGVLGYLFRKLDVPIPPMIRTIVLAPMMERSLRQSMAMSNGDFAIFFTRPFSATLLVIAAFFIVGVSFKSFSVVRGNDAEI
jgi:putative tricarboxylic transport membrane protein